MNVDHIGYVVKDIDKAVKSMEVLGYIFEPIVADEDRNIFISFGELNGYRIELIAPMSEYSTVENYLSKIGPTPYHICYKSSDIEADINYLLDNKFRVSIPLAPAVAFDGKRVVFLYNLSIGLIEVVEQ